MGSTDGNIYDIPDGPGQQAQQNKVMINGRELICPICGGSAFWQRETQLNTAGMTFFGLDWANVSAVNYVCEHCGYMFWFHPRD